MDGELYSADIEDADLGAQWRLGSDPLSTVFYPTVAPAAARAWVDPIPSGNAPTSSNGWGVQSFLDGLKSATSTVTDIARTAAGIQTAKDDYALKRLTSQASLDLAKAQVGAQRDVGLANAGVQSFQARSALEQARAAFASATDLSGFEARVSAVTWPTWVGLALAGAGVWFAWRAKGGAQMKRDDGMGMLYLIAAAGGLWVAWSLISGVKKAGAVAGGAAQAVVNKVGAALNAINPANPDNAIAAAVNAGVSTLTGEANTSLGSWIYDRINPGPFGVNAPVVPTPNALVRSFGGDSLTREDVAWMDKVLSGIEYPADNDDAEMGIWKRAANPQSASDRLGAAAQSYGPAFNMQKI